MSALANMHEAILGLGRMRVAGGWFCAAIVAVTLTVLVTSTIPAAARVLVHDHYSGTFSDHERSCGRHVHFEGVFSGLFMGKGNAHADQPLRSFNHYDVHEVFTLANGDGYIIDQRVLHNEMRVSHVRGSIYRLKAIEVGQVFTIRTLGGKAVERNRGLLEFSYLVDTNGDSDYRNDVFIADSFHLVTDAGKHPELTSTEEEFCAAIDEAIRG